MENSDNKQLIACIPVSTDKRKAHNLIHKLATDGSNLFSDFLIIDTAEIKPSEHIIETLNGNNLKYSYLNIPSSNNYRGLIFKKAIEYSFKNEFDYLVMFNEGWEDNYDDFIKYMTSGSYLTYSLTVSPRKPKRINPGRFINSFTNLLSTISLGFKVLDTKGDSINMFKVKSFYQKDEDKIFALSDDNWYFQDLLAVYGYHRQTVNFLPLKSLETPGSSVKLNTSFMLKSFCRNLSYIFSKSNFIEKFKGTINPRTIKVYESSNSTKKLNKVDTKTINEIREIKKSQRDALKQDFKIPEIKANEVINLPILSHHEIDPDSPIIRLDHIDSKNKEVVVINWCLTNICNYRCSYCPEDLHNGTAKGPKLEDIKAFFFKVKEYHPNKTLFFEFTGGEVTYYKEFLPLIKFIKENGGDVGIISNGARKLDVWEKYHDYIDHICLSFHSEQGDADHFYDVVAYLTDKMTTHVNIMMKPENFDQCHDLAQKIASNCQVSIAMQPLLEEMDGELFDYTKEQKLILDKQSLNYSENPEHKRKDNYEDNIYRGAMRATLADLTSTIYASPELISRQMNRWSGWECYTGVENISIGMNGAIYRGWCMVGGTIGNISDKNLQLPTKPILCNKSQCSCGQDIMCTKVRVS